MSDTYTREEFAACFQRRGYGVRKQAREWMNGQGRETFSEPDFEICWRALNAPQIVPRQSKYIAIGINGMNLSDPEYMPDSEGRTFEAEMKIQQRLTAALDARIKRRKEEGGNDENA